MSYTVEYNPESRNSYPMNTKKHGKWPIKSFAVMLGIVIVIYALNAFGFLRYIIPGDPTVTVGAFSNMVEEVRSGQTVSEAMLMFFKNIITGGLQP